MRWLLRIALFLAGTVLLVLVVGFCWLYFYSRDLPDITVLAQYAPVTAAKVTDPCLSPSIAVPSVAIPYGAIGENVRHAISAVEVREDDPGVLGAELWKAGQFHRRTLSEAVSTLACYAPSRALKRRLAEIRTATQLERHYSRRQLFTIYSNRLYFGFGQTGIYAGAEFYFHKEPRTVNLPEAALLAGLLRSPTRYSPFMYPDRALRRRNEVIDAMIENGSIMAGEAQAAKATPLGIVPSTTGAP